LLDPRLYDELLNVKDGLQFPKEITQRLVLGAH